MDTKDPMDYAVFCLCQLEQRGEWDASHLRAILKPLLQSERERIAAKVEAMRWATHLDATDKNVSRTEHERAIDSAQVAAYDYALSIIKGE